jgi:ribonuclease HI
MLDLRALKIYVDGACPRNVGGRGGFAAWCEFPFDWGKPDERLESRGYFHTTNNRMELRACLFAHEWILEQGDDIGVQHVQIVTDSKYVCEGYRCSLNWSQNDWRTLHGRAAENVDLWKQVLRLRKKLGGRPRVEVVKIDRCSSEIATFVDRDAKAAAKSPQFKDDGYKPGKIGRTRNNSGKAAKMYATTKREVIILIYRTKIVTRDTQKVVFQTYCESRRDFFDKYWAQADNAIANSLHRGNVFLVRMNDQPQNPRILSILASLDKNELIGKPAFDSCRLKF